MEIVEITIGSLENETACGEGRIQTELIKYVKNKLFNWLTSLFKRCLNEEVAEAWKIGFMSVIHKK